MVNRTVSPDPPRAQSGKFDSEHQRHPTAFERGFLIALFVLASGLRVALGIANSQANDFHLPVVRVIAFEHRLPGMELWEGYQPKLYYLVTAVLWNLIPRNDFLEVRTAQLVNVIAGILTLIAIWRFLSRIHISFPSRLVTFSLIALNPRLIGINAQATNDTFVILFGTLALYKGYEFFTTWRTRSFWYATAFTILASISKGNGLVIFLAFLVTFALAYLTLASSERIGKFAFIYVLVFLATVPFLGGYWSNYVRYGTPFAVNKPSARPGYLSVTQSFLTFRLLDMLRNPYLTYGPEIKPLHRTSLWSQLYGRTHFLQYDAHPPAWRTNPGDVRTLAVITTMGRIALILALVPTSIWIVGMYRALVHHFRGILTRSSPVSSCSWTLLLVAGFGYLAFEVAYSYANPDVGTMKAIFVFPALLAYFGIFGVEMDRMYRRKICFTACILVAICPLLITYVGCVTGLCFQLLTYHFPF